MAPDRQLLPHGSTSPCGQTSDLQEKPDIRIFFSLNLLSFNSIFRKYCVCGTKYICELGVDCGLWLSAFVLNHCTWIEHQKKKKHKKTICEHICVSRGGSA